MELLAFGCSALIGNASGHGTVSDPPDRARRQPPRRWLNLCSSASTATQKIFLTLLSPAVQLHALVPWRKYFLIWSWQEELFPSKTTIKTSVPGFCPENGEEKMNSIYQLLILLLTDAVHSAVKLCFLFKSPVLKAFRLSVLPRLRYTQSAVVTNKKRAAIESLRFLASEQKQEERERDCPALRTYAIEWNRSNFQFSFLSITITTCFRFDDFKAIFNFRFGCLLCAHISWLETNKINIVLWNRLSLSDGRNKPLYVL